MSFESSLFLQACKDLTMGDTVTKERPFCNYCGKPIVLSEQYVGVKRQKYWLAECCGHGMNIGDSPKEALAPFYKKHEPLRRIEDAERAIETYKQYLSKAQEDYRICSEWAEREIVEARNLIQGESI